MKFLVLILVLTLGLWMGMPLAGAQEARPELRAFWADGYSEGFKTPEQVDTLLQRLHDAHCNAIFAQMRKGGDAYYASRYEPWAKDDTAHFDALACLIAKAHAMTPPIAVHAWINTCAVGGNGTNPFNIVHLHRDWLSLNPKGEDFDGEATKIDPGNPDAAEWTFRIYLDVARHYDVDGIHFDFVRYGGREWGYNPLSVARFQQQFGAQPGIKQIEGTDLPAPDDTAWKQWRRDQVTNLVRKVYVHAAQVHPKLVVSAAVITWADAPHTEEEWFTKSAAMNRTLQDWRGWLEEGMIDLACPMTYFQADTHTDWQRNWSEFVKNHQYHRAATIAVGTWFNTIGQSLDFIQNARQPSAKGRRPYGVMLYCYSGTNAGDTKDAKGKRQELQYQPAFYTALSQPMQPASSNAASTGTASGAHSSSTGTAPPFTADAPLPPMPWKTEPRAGYLKGFALTATLDPVDGAIVTVRAQGKKQTRRTDGTGFYAFVDLPPGEATVTLAAPGYQKQQAKAKITAGQVATAHFTLGSAASPLVNTFAALQNALLPQGSGMYGPPIRMQNLLVRIGTDTFPGNLYVQDSEGTMLRVRLANPPLLPFQPGDVVSVNGTLLSVEGEMTLDRAIVRLTDILPQDAMPAPKQVTEASLNEPVLPRCAGAKIEGILAEVTPQSLTLDTEGKRILIPLAGRKEFGVESTQLQITPPLPGSKIQAEGVLTTGTAADGKTPQLRLHLNDSQSLKILAPPVAFWQHPMTLGVASCFFRPYIAALSP